MGACDQKEWKGNVENGLDANKVIDLSRFGKII